MISWCAREVPDTSFTEADIELAKSQYRELLKKKKAKTNKAERLRGRLFRKAETSRKTKALTGRHPNKKDLRSDSPFFGKVEDGRVAVARDASPLPAALGFAIFDL